MTIYNILWQLTPATSESVYPVTGLMMCWLHSESLVSVPVQCTLLWVIYRRGLPNVEFSTATPAEIKWRYYLDTLHNIITYNWHWIVDDKQLWHLYHPIHFQI